MAKIATIQVLIDNDSPQQILASLFEESKDVVDWTYFNPELMKITPVHDLGYCYFVDCDFDFDSSDYQEGQAFLTVKV